MNHDDKTTPVEQEQLAQPEQARNAHQKHQDSRRRLLKAAAVAPVIYTLPVGNSVAASSTCETKTDNFVYLTDEEIESIKVKELKPGDELDTEYYVYNNKEKVKASCWCSLNPTASGCGV